VSGALAPGPLLAACLAAGARGGARAGILVAAGHAAVELPLVLALGAGAVTLAAVEGSGAALAIAGAAALFVFAAMHARSALLGTEPRIMRAGGPLTLGILLSALNPFFITWWLTIGLKLVSDASAELGVAGAPAVFGMHVWMDFAWLGAVAFLASRGRRMAGSGGRRAMDAGIAALMALAGVWFLAGI
ncbi:MAG: LysE family translocator, partial [Nitrosopumilus sp.]|nr:LysE family translocator [Nitrosopumilus sp.]